MLLLVIVNSFLWAASNGGQNGIMLWESWEVFKIAYEFLDKGASKNFNIV